MDQHTEASSHFGFHQIRQCVHRVLLEGQFEHLGMTKLYPDDIEYENATNVAHQIDRDLPGKIAVEDFRRIVDVFAESMGRIRSFHWFPVDLIYQTRIVATAHAIAAIKCGSDPMDLARNASEEEDTLGSEIFQSLLDKSEKSFGNVSMAVWYQGNMALKNLLSAETQGLTYGRTIGVQAVLAAIVTASYAALETLAGDLWIAAVNRHPQLAENWISKNNQKQLTFNELRGHRFNLTHAMGRLLTQSRKVQFNSFNDIRSAYSDAFLDDGAAMFGDYRDVFIAEKVRHIIAHRAGIVDAKFREEMKDVPVYQNVPEGERIPITGPLVAGHFGACLKMGEAIALAVDRWSSAAPTE